MKEDMLGHACSMHGRVQKCVGLQNLIRKYDGRRYNRRLEDNIKNERIIRDSCGSEWGRVLGFFTYGFFFLLSEDSSDIGVVVTDLRHHRSLLGPAKIYPRNAMGFCNVIVRVSEWMNSFCYSRKNRRFWTWCLSVRPSLHMPREEKPTRCHCILYGTYDTLNMFRALLCPPSGGRGIIRRKRDHQDEEGSSGGRGIIRRKRDVPRHSCATSLFLDAHPAFLHLTPDNQQPSTAHHRR